MVKRIEAVLESVKSDISGKLDMNFITDEVLDSLDIMNLIVAIEEEFDIEIDPEDVITDNFETVNAIKLLIEKCQ